MSLLIDESFDFDDIEERLQDKDPEIRRVAVMELADAAEDEAQSLAIKALSDEDANVRKQAAMVLDEYESLVTALERLFVDFVLLPTGHSHARSTNSHYVD